MYKAWEIRRVCGGISLPWSGGGWRRRDCCGRGLASPRWRGEWEYTANRSVGGRGSWSSLVYTGCAKHPVLVVQQSWTAANWPNSNWRLNWGPRRSDTPADCGAHGGYGISSSTKPGCDTTKTTSGASCASLTGHASDPRDGRWSVTRRESATGSNTVGHSLKKSPGPRPHDHLHRRKRIERTPPPSANLGATRTDAGTAISLQLEGDVGGGRHHLVELLLPALSRDHQGTPGSGLSRPSVALSPRQALGDLGRLPAHRARLVSEFIRAQGDRLMVERLPGYAPELNPVEYIWGYWKHHELPNFCPRDFSQLSCHARTCVAPHAPSPFAGPFLLASSSTVTIICSSQ